MSEGAYDYVGIVMAKSAEGDAVADALRKHPDVTVIEQPSFWEIKAKDRLVIDFDEVSELGFEIDGYAIQHEMSTHATPDRDRRRPAAGVGSARGDGAPERVGPWPSLGRVGAGAAG